MTGLVFENGSRTRRAVVIDGLVLFMTRRPSEDYRSPRQWAKQEYASIVEAVRAASLYVTSNRLPGVPRRVPRLL